MESKQFEPTHFLEQYNAKEGYRFEDRPNEMFTDVLPISILSYRNEFMMEMTTLFTVAIWKIKFKPQPTI